MAHPALDELISIAAPGQLANETLSRLASVYLFFCLLVACRADPPPASVDHLVSSNLATAIDRAVLLSVVRLLLLYLPLGWLGAQLRGVQGLVPGAAAANLLIGVIACWGVSESCELALRHRLDKG